MKENRTNRNIIVIAENNACKTTEHNDELSKISEMDIFNEEDYTEGKKKYLLNKSKTYKKMKKEAKKEKRNGFTVYLEISGHREYVKTYRHNGLLYSLLKDGVALDDLKRWKPFREGMGRTTKYGATQLYDSVRHLIDIIDYVLADFDSDAA